MSEMFTVRLGATGVPTLYVPDIILHDRSATGKAIIIEPLDVNTPRIGNTRIIADFRREMGEKFFVIVIARRCDKPKVQREAYDLLVEAEDLNSLESLVPRSPR
jgi:hypothetical protein